MNLMTLNIWGLQLKNEVVRHKRDSRECVDRHERDTCFRECVDRHKRETCSREFWLSWTLYMFSRMCWLSQMRSLLVEASIVLSDLNVPVHAAHN